MARVMSLTMRPCSTYCAVPMLCSNWIHDGDMATLSYSSVVSTGRWCREAAARKRLD